MPASPIVTAQRRPTFRFKAANVGADGSFSGYGSVFGAVDSYGDIVLPGAFQATLDRHKLDGTRPKGLWQHDDLHPILTWTEIREDQQGLYCAGQLILEVEKARETHALMKAGELDGLSIGYHIGAFAYCHPDEVETKYGLRPEPDAPVSPNGQYRMIETIQHLAEVSVVTWPACTPAKVQQVRRAPTPAAPDLTALAAALDRRAAALSRLR